MIGRTLAQYRIVEPLGAGGMGEVYRARDEKLDREVALKVLPEGALSDDQARARFRREARALSRLSHPHIATLFDFDTAEGIDFLAMELVTGPSLRDELEARGALPEKTVVRLGAQMARALQAAHAKGVIHRDLKPSNVQLTDDGLVKILDFGLARLTPAGPQGLEPADVTRTAVGRAAGTLPYMSPEQLRGRDVDARADLYALGALLYELATGRRPFSKPSAADLTDAILNEEPAPPRALDDRLTPALEGVILKSLDKDPELRHQTATDFLVDLERLQRGSDPPPAGRGRVGRRLRAAVPPRRLTRGILGVALLLAVSVGVIWMARRPPPPRITEVRPLHIDVGPEFAGPMYPMWATDGVRVYYTVLRDGSHRLMQLVLGGGEPAEIETPFSLLEIQGFVRRQSALVVLGHPASEPTDYADAPLLWLLPLPAGPPRQLAGLRANGAAVSPDGEEIALFRGRRLILARADGTDVRTILDFPHSSTTGWLRWSPAGERIRFSGSAPPGRDGDAWIWETTRDGEDLRALWPGRRGDWTMDGRHFLLERQEATPHRTDIYAVRELPRLPWIRPEPVQLTFGPVSFDHVGTQPDGAGLLGFGRDRRGEVRRFDRRTERFEPVLAGESAEYVVPSVDGQWLAWVRFPDGSLWRERTDGSDRRQLTGPSERAWLPSWSPDGRRIAFVGQRAGASDWRVRLVDSEGGPVETLSEGPPGSNHWDPCWLPDGRSVIFSDVSRSRPGIHQVDVATGSTTLFTGAEDLVHPKCSPDGRVLASRPIGARFGTLMVYSPESGEWEELGPKLLGFPGWTRDGESICGLKADDLTAIQCCTVATGRVETLAELEELSLLFGTAGWPWMGLDADDNPLIVVDRSTRDFYALAWEAP